METEPWEVTVVHGRQSLRVALPAPNGDAAWLDALQAAVEQQTGVACAHQKLLFKGKAVTRATVLTDGAKLMLLKSAQFHQRTASSTKPTTHTDAMDHQDQERPPPVALASSQRLGLAASDVDEDHVLVCATRGKRVFEFLVPRGETIAAVKARVGGALGLAGAALRLLVKGKTPSDTPLASFVATGGPRVVKCMVLFQASQHDLMDHEETFHALQNDLTKVEADATRLAKAMVRNALSPDEVRVRLHALQDHAARLQSNLDIVHDQLQATKLAQGSTTLNALAHAKQQCEALQARVAKLTNQFESGR